MHKVASRLAEAARLIQSPDVGLSLDELLCFLCVAREPGVSVGELVDRTGLPQSTVSRHLKKLSARDLNAKGGWGPIQWELEVERTAGGLVEQRVHPVRSSQKALHVTPKGEALLARLGEILEPEARP